MAWLRSLRARAFPNPGYYGWVIVGVGFLCSMLSSPGQSFALSLYLEHLIADLGVTRLELSTLYAVATLMAAACLPLVGGWADRISGRRFLTGVLVLMGGAFLFFTRVQGVIALAAAFFALRLLGQGAIGLGTLTMTVRWFRRYRGRALAMVTLGYAFGEMVFPGVIYALIEGVGWRGSLLVFAVLYLLVLAPLIAWLSRERIAEDGPLDGWPADADGRGSGKVETSHPETSFSLAEALRMPVFWGMLLCVSVPPMLVTAVIFHQVALFEAQGWGAGMVPASFMAFAVFGVVMTYVTGLLIEKVPSRLAVSLALGLMTLAFAAASLTALPPAAGALLYGAVLGLSNGTSKTANSMVWPEYFGIEALGAVKGVVNAARNGATAVGPPLAALLVGGSGSFTLALFVFGAIATVAGIGAVFLRSPAVDGVGGETSGAAVG